MLPVDKEDFNESTKASMLEEEKKFCHKNSKFLFSSSTNAATISQTAIGRYDNCTMVKGDITL
jgi:hypothetical protein